MWNFCTNKLYVNRSFYELDSRKTFLQKRFSFLTDNKENYFFKGHDFHEKLLKDTFKSFFLLSLLM